MKLKAVLSEILQPSYVYHGGPLENLSELLSNFRILGYEDKLKLASTGGGEFGLSTSLDYNTALKYSNVHGSNKVLKIEVLKGANIKYVDTEIPDFNYDELEEMANEGYDAVLETVVTAEKEMRIFNAKKFKPIKLM